MALVQVTLDVSDSVMKDILDNNHSIMGMVKDGAAKVRKHIKPVKVERIVEEKVKKTGIKNILKEHKVVAAMVGGAVAIGGAGAYLYTNRKVRKKAVVEERLQAFQSSMKEYLKASRKGKLDKKVVDNLLFAIEQIEKNKLGAEIQITISASQFSELIFSIFSYTETLAEVNAYKIKVKKPKVGIKGEIVSLKNYLDIQKEILDAVV